MKRKPIAWLLAFSSIVPYFLLLNLFTFKLGLERLRQGDESVFLWTLRTAPFLVATSFLAPVIATHDQQRGKHLSKRFVFTCLIIWAIPMAAFFVVTLRAA